MSTHESFEQLCALATTGDLSSDEFRQLREHLLECASCRAAYGDFHAIVEQGFPVLDRPHRGWSLPQIGMKRRFAARARKEGIAVFGRKDGPSRGRNILVGATVSVLLLVLVLFSYETHLYRTDLVRQSEAESTIAILSSKIAELDRRLSESRQPEALPIPPARVETSGGQVQDMALSLLRRDYDAAVASRAELEANLSALLKELAEIRKDSLASRAEVEGLDRNLREAEANLSRSRVELQQLRVALSTNVATITAQQGQLTAFTVRNRDQAETIRVQNEAIQRDRELLAREKDIRDLMGARDLRIVDVRDEGTPGKVRPVPGRIFYTHGKELVLYAYDLQNKGKQSNEVFQVWGKRDGRSQAPRSLGILEIDDSSQNRWVLKFEDPDVLAQIDQVFVTVEPPGSREPSSKQLLTAAFLNEPNRP